MSAAVHEAASPLVADLMEAWRRYDKAQRKSLALAEATMKLGGNTTRARLTTANAAWAREAEYRDQALETLRAAVARLAEAVPLKKVEVVR
jgi:hypothetical protein